MEETVNFSGFGGGIPVQVGDRAPEIQLTDTSGGTFSSAAKVADGPLVVAFYPLAFTGG